MEHHEEDVQSHLSSGFWDAEEDLETVWFFCWSRWRLVSFWGFQTWRTATLRGGGASQGTLGKLRAHRDTQWIIKMWSLSSRHITDQTAWSSRMLKISIWVGNVTLNWNVALCLQCCGPFTKGPKLSPLLGLGPIQIPVSEMRKRFS